MKPLPFIKISAWLMNISLVIMMTACKKNENYLRVNGFEDRAVNAITGRITDLNNQPVSNAIVTLNSLSTTTDMAGSYILKNIQLNNNTGFITVTKPGYFTGSRTFFSNRVSTKFVNIKLIPKTVSGTFAASAGGTVNVWGGGKVVIEAGSMVYARTGSAYNGNVSVSSFYLNPADYRFPEYMPGDLFGVNSNNEERILQSFGMLSIEMNDAGGEKLQLAPGKTATIQLPIPPILQANAPAVIPLWYFDETSGVWKEEGSAARSGNNYTGTVSHFSFWNCDLSAKYVQLTVTFKNQKGIPLANHLVTITSNVSGTRSGYTDSEGTVSGLIPANETLVLRVYDQCREVIYSSTIGPFSADVNLGTIIITGPNNQIYLTVSGSVVPCNNALVTKGYVLVNNGLNYFSAPLVNGGFIITFPVCIGLNNPITLITIDETNSQQSDIQIVNINNGDQNIGQITACIDLSL
jgi:hypothetical protein